MKSLLQYMIVITSFFSQTSLLNIDDYYLEYEIVGSGKHTVLLEAGMSSSMTDWDPVIKEFSKHAKIIRYSRIGNGKSTKIRRHFSAEDSAEILRKLLNRLGITEKVLIVAHSYGGIVARTFSAINKQMVSGLMLIDTSIEDDVAIMRSINLELANKEINQRSEKI